ncbi:MAG: oxygen-dependent coproporphyrinogen oxidase [Rickettsiaceae bacterium]|nr:oxygen-dependent coproporphyrinogen oxidase [Rickettsiaceae bacterium]
MNMTQKEKSSSFFEELRNQICGLYEDVEKEYCTIANIEEATPGKFERKKWHREGGGGGEISIMRGSVFEKVGVNISTVYGEFSEEFAKQIPGAEDNPSFFATGISLVAHMKSPLVPAVHFNSRYIETSKNWFGGGGDLTPMYEDIEETEYFHSSFKEACDKHDKAYYTKFKQQCDEYFFLKHRNEPRGVGGIFFDYHNTGSFENDFAFVRDVGLAFKETYANIVRKKMNLPWTLEQREFQLRKRGRYVEFNLLYDRGTTFGLKTGGNVEAILMSLPPEVKW